MGRPPDVWGAKPREDRPRPATPLYGGSHGRHTHRSARRSHQGGRDRRPDRPALVRGGRERQRRPDGRRRHQRPRRPAGSPARAAPRGRRDGRRRRRRRGDQARPARSGRRHPRRHLQLHAAGHQGPRRGRGQDALPLPRAVRGAGVRSADLLHRPGAGAAGRPVHPVADARDRGEDVLPAVRRLHLAARAERARPGGRHGQRRDDRRRGVLPARPHGLSRDRRADRRERCRRGVQHDRAPGRHAVLPGAPRLRLHGPRRAARLHVLRRELPEHGPGRPGRGALRLPRLLPGRRRSVQPEAARAVRRAVSRRRGVHRRQRVLGPLPRAAPLGRRGDRGRVAATRRT